MPLKVAFYLSPNLREFLYAIFLICCAPTGFEVRGNYFSDDISALKSMPLSSCWDVWHLTLGQQPPVRQGETCQSLASCGVLFQTRNSVGSLTKESTYPLLSLSLRGEHHPKQKDLLSLPRASVLQNARSMVHIVYNVAGTPLWCNPCCSSTHSL